MADFLLRPVGQLLRQLLEVVPRPALHGDGLVVQPEGAFLRIGEVDSPEEGVGEESVDVGPQFQDLLVQVRVIALLEEMKVIHLVVVELVDDGPQRRVLHLRQREAVEVVGVQLELDGVPDRQHLHGIVELVPLDQLERLLRTCSTSRTGRRSRW